MSAICQNFSQNAWKKDLCSNCFKSKDEHNHLDVKKLAVAADKVKGSIIKTKKNLKNKYTVSFTNQLAEVIGYGGEDWSEEEEDNKSSDDNNSYDSETEIDEEDERELKKLTKANTDFNTINANLIHDSNDIKKSYTHLKLGTPQIDSEGRKQTLLVSVTPFGQERTISVKKFTKAISHIPVAKTKDTIAENKSSAILTSYSTKNNDMVFQEEKSLLEEISETLENSITPIQIISRKIILSNDIDKSRENEYEIKSSTYLLEKAAEKSTEKIKDLKAKSNIPERKNGITRAPVIKRDQEKPLIYQTSTARIELLNNKNLQLIKETLGSKILESKTNKTELKHLEDKVEDFQMESQITENEFEQKEIQDMHNIIQIENTTDESSEDSSTEAGNSLTESANADQEDLEKLHSTLSESREQAGEPDGHADPDGNSEPPALPTTPPPLLETRSSFLHGNAGLNDKPKLPLKPATVLIRKPVTITNQLETQSSQQTLTTFVVEAKLPEEKLKLEKQDSVECDIARTSNKRRAPKPPSITELPLFSKCDDINNSNDFPVIKEKDKRERASPCNPKMRNDTEEVNESNASSTPEPAPRKSLSFSTDSLSGIGTDEKKKEKSKGRFSLKKFLRMNSNKDSSKTQESPKYEEVKFPEPKPRLVIVHPLELNGAKVEVVSKPLSHDQIDNGLTMISHSNYCSKSSDLAFYEQRAVKPPPPPRNLEDWQRRNRPNLPHPPKSAEIINKQKHLNRSNNLRLKNDSVYANIGEVRSAITPNKPQRTASMREREALAQKRQPSDNYEFIDVTKGGKENVYDYISGMRSGTPDSDSSPDKNSLRNKSIPRSASLTYCGSETESEIYSPYSFYGSESEVTEDDRDWNPNGKTYKLRSRKGRSIVHKNLEDNYGAVVIANHEALAQVLENIQQGPQIQPALRGLKTSTNLRWTDFSIKENLPALTVGHRVFHQAVWGAHHVTVVISTGPTPTSTLSLSTFNLVPITEFTDLVPVKYLLANFCKDDAKLVEASIEVLPWLQVNTIQTYTELLKSKSSNSSQEELFKDACFIVLQLVNALKMLQAQGIEELPLSLTSFVLCREIDKDLHHRLCVLQGLGEEITQKKENVKFGSLCLCATTVLTHLLPNAKLTPLLRSLLNTERAVSLTQVKSILEFSLWGPADVALSPSIKERELALQRWLDLQRATVLHGLVCTRIQLTVYEECQLLFLVRSNAKMMCDASLLLDAGRQSKVLQGKN